MEFSYSPRSKYRSPRKAEAQDPQEIVGSLAQAKRFLEIFPSPLKVTIPQKGRAH